MSRYILIRIAEDLHIGISFDPKPVAGWMGCGAHTNFSTEAMRAEGGLAEIKRAMDKLSKNHAKHVQVYDPHGGADNTRRLTGQLWSSDLNKFSWGIADRAASVRIPKQVAQAGKGYFEDRRPASNCDPYAVTEALVRTCCLNE
jgi:glutamine synthetase